MIDTLKVIPAPDDVTTGAREDASVAEGLADVLAETYRLTVKTHAYHWNVTGSAFYSIHKLTEDHYETMFAAADKVAARNRTQHVP